MVVRGFCCVKFGAGWIPAYAGMTWEGFLVSVLTGEHSC